MMNVRKEFFLANLLYDAIDSVDIKGVKLTLLEKRANPNYFISTKGITPFHLAVGITPLNYSLEITKLILENGGDPNIRSEEGYTPLHIAAYYNRLNLVKLLVSHGADPEVMDSLHKTPNDYANEENHTNVYTFLTHMIIANIISHRDGMKSSYNFELDKIILERGEELMEMTFHNHYDYKISPLSSSTINHVTRSKANTNKEENINSINNRKLLQANIVDSSSGFSSEQDKRERYVVPKRKSNKIDNVTIGFNVEEELNTAICKLPAPSNESGVWCAAGDEILQVPSQTDSYYTCSDHVECAGCSHVTTTNDGLQIEIRKYEDKSENIVLYERRVSSITSNDTEGSSRENKEIAKTSSLTSGASTTELRHALSTYEYQSGPITSTTKSLYVKKLRELKQQYKQKKNGYSKSLEIILERPFNNVELIECNRLESLLMSKFSKPDTTKRWREGTRKSSFNYLLLDPRITLNLPERQKDLNDMDVWKTFIMSIFYIGKGKKVRPYDHLYEAIKYRSQHKTIDKKIEHILDIWKNKMGVVCLHVFHNSIPVESFTREAAMISAIKLRNLKNIKNGEFYGPAVSWTDDEKNLYGTYLLHKCMNIYLLEGEKQISPDDF